MANNAVLRYLDRVWKTRHPGDNSGFASYLCAQEHSDCSESTPLLTPPRNNGSNSDYSPTSIPPSPSNHKENLPIHQILSTIKTAEAEKNADFFEPFVVHYWQLQRLLDGLRCSTPVFKLRSELRKLDAEINALEDQIKTGIHNQSQSNEEDKANLKAYQEAKKRLNDAFSAALKKDQDIIQTILLVSRLLNISLRNGMSVPMLAEQLRLDTQEIHCIELLSKSGIQFDPPSESHDLVITKGTVLERITRELSADLSWGTGLAHPPANSLAIAELYVSRVIGTQDFHSFYNHFRLGITRFRRFLVFLDPYLQNPLYTSVFKLVDPYVRSTLAYLNWMFFIPRLSLNLSLLFYHGLGLSSEPLERELSMATRFQVQWSRLWFEIIPDLYWLLMGLKVCFWLPDGVLSPLGIALNLTTQALDLILSIIRAGIELHRLDKMASELKACGCPSNIQDQLNKRFWFEVQALSYMVLHFSILLLCLCLTLPLMATATPLLPVIGCAVAALMTMLTYFMQNYFIDRRRAEFELRPISDSPQIPSVLSHGVISG